MIIVGHRGARGLAPENTIQALHKALEHGADILEFDIRTTQDGVAILHHDLTLTDPDGTHHLIATTDFAELKQHKADITTLATVFETLDTSTTLYIEVKLGSDTAPVVAVIAKYLAEGWKAEHVMLASKSQKVLVELKAALPDCPLIVIEPWSGVRATTRAKALNTQYLAMNQLFLWKPFIMPMAHRGWKLFAYTLNNPRRAHRWTKYGLYATVTDYPDRFGK